MENKLLAEILKAQDNLQTIEFKFMDEEYKWYYRYMTLLEKVRIQQMCVKPNVTINTDGTTTTKMEEQSHLIPIHTIIEKALDEEGKKLFNHAKDFDTISKLPAGLASYIAYEMQLDIFGTMKPKDDSDGK